MGCCWPHLGCMSLGRRWLQGSRTKRTAIGPYRYGTVGSLIELGAGCCLHEPGPAMAAMALCIYSSVRVEGMPSALWRSMPSCRGRQDVALTSELELPQGPQLAQAQLAPGRVPLRPVSFQEHEQLCNAPESLSFEVVKLQSQITDLQREFDVLSRVCREELAALQTLS